LARFKGLERVKQAMFDVSYSAVSSDHTVPKVKFKTAQRAQKKFEKSKENYTCILVLLRDFFGLLAKYHCD